MSKPYWSGSSAGEETPVPGDSPIGGDVGRGYLSGYQSRYRPAEGYGAGHQNRYQTGGSQQTGESHGTGHQNRYQTGSGYNPYLSSYAGYRHYGQTGTDTYDPPAVAEYEDYPDHPDNQDPPDLPPPDTRWRWVAGLAAMVLLAALIAIGVAMRDSDAESNSAATTTPSPQPSVQDAISSTAPRTVIATVPPTSAPPAPGSELPAETVVTVTPSPSAVLPPAPPVPAEAPPVPPGAAPAAQTITYSVTGTRQLFDLVSIIYTDEQGFPRTDVNVALPWTKTVVLNPGVLTKSVTATSLTGQLNCSVTDITGATISAQTNNAAITTCTS